MKPKKGRKPLKKEEKKERICLYCNLKEKLHLMKYLELQMPQLLTEKLIKIA